MQGINFSLFWIVAVPSFFTWAAGIFLVLKGLSEAAKPISLQPQPEEEPAQPIAREGAAELRIPESRTTLEELEIPIAHEGGIDSRVPDKRNDAEEFYRSFGKANVIEFPAEYVSGDSVKGLDGREISLADFVKNCYAQIGFRVVETLLVEKKPKGQNKVSVFDLVCDHYTSDEDQYVEFFGRNKERFSDEILSLKANPEFIYQNMKELTASYDDLPQLVVWNEKELFLLFIKSKTETLTQKEIRWLREFVMQKKLFRAKIFKIVERKPGLRK